MKLSKQEALKQLKDLENYIKNYNEIDSVNDINNIEDAERVLKNCKNHIQYLESQFVRKRDWITYQLETIIKAANFLDNDSEEWVADFNKRTISKYYPYFEKVSSSWSVCGVNGYYFCPSGAGVFYYKERNTANLISKKFISLYNQYLG